MRVAEVERLVLACSRFGLAEKWAPRLTQADWMKLVFLVSGLFFETDAQSDGISESECLMCLTHSLSLEVLALLLALGQVELKCLAFARLVRLEL